MIQSSCGQQENERKNHGYHKENRSRGADGQLTQSYQGLFQQGERIGAAPSRS